MKDVYIKPSNGFLLFYDITMESQFASIKDDIERILRDKYEDHFPMVLETKCDLEKERKILLDEGREFANKYEIPFLETSAKVCINIEEVIFSLVGEIHKTKNQRNQQKTKKDCLLM
jgi:GTPase SAR1 family protein